MNEELYHHGILGQKWGIRRFQNSDGTLTEAGRKRYAVNLDSAKKKYNDAKIDYRKSMYNKTGSHKMAEWKTARNNLRWAKEDLYAEKMKERLNRETKPKSKHRTELEEMYKRKGMSEEEAAIAAYKRSRTEKILAATAGIALASATAYVAYKHYDKTVDKFLKEGTDLTRIARSGDKSVHDAFYASLSSNKMDVAKYKGIYGSRIKIYSGDVYQKNIEVNHKIKIASEKSAIKILQKIAKDDPTYTDALIKVFNDTRGMDVGQSRVCYKAIDALREGKINSSVYEALNLNLIKTDSDVNKSFYKYMKDSGYGALVDVNDKKLSGYMAKMPLIVFDSENVTVKNVIKLGEEEMRKAEMKALKDIKLKENVAHIKYTAEWYRPQAVAMLGSCAALKATISLTKKINEDAIVENYRKEHPNTDLSYNEILRMRQNSA